MGSIGAPEILVILIVALLVLGPERLPEAARQAGRVLAEVRRMSNGFQAELRDALDTPLAGPPAPADTPTAAGTIAAVSARAPGEQKFLWSDLPTSSGESSS